MIVGAGERHDGIEQARFLQAEENRVRAELGAEAAFAEFVVGLTGLLLAIGIADFGFFFAAAFEDTQDVSWLRNFPAEERVEFGEDALGAGFFGRGEWRGLDGLWQAV